MSQLPRDPRQLARDILSGKVKLEDLARERARQQMPGGIAPTARVPSPRAPMPPQQKQVEMAPARPPAFPQRPVQTPAQRRPMQPPPPPPTPPPMRQQPVQRQRVQMPPAIPQRGGRAVTQSMQARTAAADKLQAQNVAQAAREEAARPAPMNSGRVVVRQMMRNRQSLRTGILMSEILGPCKALRDDF